MTSEFFLNPTASSWDRIMKCAPSGVTELVTIRKAPHPRADHGTKTHRYASLCLLMGPVEAGKAMLAAGADKALVANLVTVDVKKRLTEIFGPGLLYRSEHPMAYRVDTNTARHLPAGQERDYSDCTALEIPGTWDVFWETADAIYCIDFKTSEMFTAKELLVEHCWQLNIGLIAWNAAGMTDAKKRRVKAIVHWADDGHWTWAMEEVSPEYLQLAAMTLDKKLVEIRENNPQNHQAGGHCKFCPKYDTCPATTSLLTSMVKADGADDLIRNVSAADAVRLVKRLKALAAELDERMKEYARHSPIDMGNGKVYKEVQVVRKSVDTSNPRAMSIISKYGADEAVVYKSSATASALQAAVGNKKRFGEMMKEIREADGMVVSTRFSQLKEVDKDDEDTF